jgi:L-iditol 2-dehydrogenase
MIACRLGARVVATDLSASRRREALARGALVALDPIQSGAANDLRDSLLSLSSNRGADVAIVAVPNTNVISSALNAVRPAGKVLLFAQTRLNDAVEIDAGEVCSHEKALIGSYSSDITLQQEAADLIFSRKIDVRGLVTHRFDLDSISEAIDLAKTPCENSLKILVTP